MLFWEKVLRGLFGGEICGEKALDPPNTGHNQLPQKG